MEKLAMDLQASMAASAGGRKERERWLHDLAALLETLDRYLAPLVEKGLAVTEATTLRMAEPDLGEYEAPARSAWVSSRGLRHLVRIEPRGAQVAGLVRAGGERITGVKGRVDLVCGPRRWALLRHGASAWWIVPVGAGPSKKPLGESTFAAALRDLVASSEG